LILVDDASTDESSSVSAELALQDERIKLINHENNKGPAAARNAAICCARGDYLAFLDADDVWHPRKLELLVGIVARYPDYRIYFHDVSVGIFPELGEGALVAQPEHVSIWKMLVSNPAHTPATLIRRDLGLMFNSSMRYSEDYELWLRAAYPKGAIRLPVPLAGIGRSVGSTGGLSGHRWRMRKGEMQAYISFIRCNPNLLPILPSLLCWSLGKHVLRLGRDLVNK